MSSTLEEAQCRRRLPPVLLPHHILCDRAQSARRPCWLSRNRIVCIFVAPQDLDGLFDHPRGRLGRLRPQSPLLCRFCPSRRARTVETRWIMPTIICTACWVSTACWSADAVVPGVGTRQPVASTGRSVPSCLVRWQPVHTTTRHSQTGILQPLSRTLSRCPEHTFRPQAFANRYVPLA